MKKIKFIILVVLFCTAFSFTSNAQDAEKPEKSVVLFNVYESADKGYAKVIITENDQKIEEFDLEGFHADQIEKNQIDITRALSRYIRLGYKITFTNKGSLWIYGKAPGMTCMVTTYILEKQ